MDVITLHVSNHNVQTFKALESLWRQQTLCDVALESNGCSILGHRIVLAACSPYMNSLLSQHQMSTAAQVSIQFDSAMYTVLLVLVEFMYTGVLKIRSCSVQDVLHIAEDFGITSVVDACRGFITTGTMSDNSTLFMARMYAEVHNIIDSVVLKAVSKVERKNKPKKQNAELNEPRSASTWHVSQVSGRKCTLPKRYSDSVNMETDRFRNSVIREPMAGDGSGEDWSDDDNTGSEAPNDDYRISDQEKQNSGFHELTTPGSENESEANSVNQFTGQPHILQHRSHCVLSRKDRLNRIECLKCQRDFKNSKLYLEHCRKCNSVGTKSVASNRRYKCDFCDYRHYALKSVDLHMKSKHGVPFDESRYEILRCKLCPFTSIDIHRLQAHISTHSSDRPFVCNKCGERFRQETHLTVHNLRHENIRPFACKECGKKFTQKGTLKTHVERIHQKQPRFRCNQCSFTSYVRSGLYFHQYKEHGVALPAKYKCYKCSLCEYSTTNSSRFAGHSRRHTGEKPVPCTLCNKTFVDKGGLREHMKWHSGDRKFKCPHDGCTQACINNTKLQEHIRLMHTHKGEKPWTCHLCSYRCAVKGNLTKHLRSTHRMEITTKQRKVLPVAETSGDRENMLHGNIGEIEEAVVVNMLSNQLTDEAGAVNMLSNQLTDEAVVAADIIALSESAFNQANSSL